MLANTLAMFDGLWNVSIDCLVFKVLVACFYCLPTVNIPCGMCLLLVECVYGLWNVSIACWVCLMLVKGTVACLMCNMLLEQSGYDSNRRCATLVDGMYLKAPSAPPWGWLNAKCGKHLRFCWSRKARGEAPTASFMALMVRHLV